MGQRQTSNQLIDPHERELYLKHKNRQEEQKLNKNHFEFMYIVGRGGFGKVWKVYLKKNKKVYAMKEMFKAKVIDKKSERSIKNERDLLAKMKHPFIVNLHYAFQDFENLYLVLDFLYGGDLRYHISKHKRFTEEQTKFFIACLLLCYEYIHGNNVLHRDIKPENMVIDDKGYVRLTDFGIAKLYSRDNSSETSGTPGYMAPEVMCAQNHTIAVDYFALGVFGYEFMNGRRPYLGRSRKEIKEQIMSKQVQIKRQDIPSDWTVESADFINRCLQRKPANRLGLKGIQEAKEHPWLKTYPWKEHYEKKIESPFFPKHKDNFDSKYCEMIEKIGLDTKERYEAYMNDDEFPNVFRKFTYMNIDELTEKKEKAHYARIDRKEYSKSATGNFSVANTNNNLVINKIKSSGVLNNNKTSQFYKKESNVTNNTGISGATGIEGRSGINTNISSMQTGSQHGIRSSSSNVNNKNIVSNYSNVSNANLYGNSSTNNLVGNKSLRSKIKISGHPGNSSMVLNNEDKSAILSNHANIELNASQNRHHSQFKERKIIGGVASSMIFDDKINKTSIKGMTLRESSNNLKHNSLSKNSQIGSMTNIRSSISNISTNSILNNNNNTNNLNNNYGTKSSIINLSNTLQKSSIMQQGNTTSKLPEIESKLEKLKKMNSNVSTNSIMNSGMYSARGFKSNNSNYGNNNSILLNGISKKITPTKLINNGSTLSNNNITSKKITLSGNSSQINNKLSNYNSGLNSKRDNGVSPMHYLSHRDDK